jgi:CheY-like chemotaxis protein
MAIEASAVRDWDLPQVKSDIEPIADLPGTTILIVDDEDSAREQCRDVVIDCGFQARVASTTQEALEALDDHADCARVRVSYGGNFSSHQGTMMPRLLRIVLPLLLIGCLLPASPAADVRVAQPKSAAETSPQTVTISGNDVWTDTKIDLQAGERIRITCSGTIQVPADKKGNSPISTGPEGLARSWKDLMRIFPVPDGNRGTVISRIGDDGAVQPFAVGASKEISVIVPGRLFLGINQQRKDEADGSFEATIEILSPGPKTGSLVAYPPPDTPIPGITMDLLKKISRRVADRAGNPGDMVNFMILGSESDVKQIFQTAGWVQVDKTADDAIIHGLVSSLSKEEYLEMPMSILYLFGRPQDFGFAHATPFNVVKTRNHLRVWRAPFDVSGKSFWVGAATHDIGFERDDRNNGLTHKIDPDVDLEREYLGETFYGTGMLSQLTHVIPPDPLTTAVTATGGSFHSDGRILAMVLK